MNTKQNNADAIVNNALNTFGGVLGSMWRATIRFFRNIPMRILNYVKRIVNDYKRKPARKDINKVYVLVGYTTKAHVNQKFNRERWFMLMRKGLLILIFVLLLFISINRIMALINVDSYKIMFGVGSTDEITENDPFGSNNYLDESGE